jgi:prophage regulatory protein
MNNIVTIPLPETGYLRIQHIIGDPENDIPALFPVGATTWWNGVKSGKYPPAYQLSAGCTAWKVEDIRELINNIPLKKAA